MTMGPEPMMRIEWMSVRLGMGNRGLGQADKRQHGSVGAGDADASLAPPAQNSAQCTGDRVDFEGGKAARLTPSPPYSGERAGERGRPAICDCWCRRCVLGVRLTVPDGDVTGLG